MNLGAGIGTGIRPSARVRGAAKHSSFVNAPARTLMVIFGGSGDLAQRKILPALERLLTQGTAADIDVVAVGRTPREKVLPGLRQGVSAALSDRLDYLQMEYDRAGFERLRERCGQESGGVVPNTVFHMAVPPSAFGPILDGLKSAGLIPPPASARWSRILIEKPFGLDQESARRLNGMVRSAFGESQVFRLDHYLGKPAAHGIYSLRMAYPALDAVWDARFIESVHIRSKETLGCADRAGYFEGVGIVRDMIQSHLMQLLALAAMDLPRDGDPSSLRRSRSEVFVRIAKLESCGISECLRGRYGGGIQDGVSARPYLTEPGVPADSVTETYARIPLRIHHPRWQGVPFHLEAGKRMDRKETTVEVRFRRPGLELEEGPFVGRITRLRFRIQPEADILADFEDGSSVSLPAASLPGYFPAEDLVLGHDGYAVLFKHALEGNSSLFVGEGEAEEAWSCLEPLLQTWARKHPERDPMPDYPPGWTGPDVSNATGAASAG
jgi:glucose-6-phosphate 1-dehydrogenase